MGHRVNQSLLAEYVAATNAEMKSNGCLRACAFDATIDAYKPTPGELKESHVTFLAALALGCGVLFKVTLPVTLGPMVDNLDEPVAEEVEIQACADERNLVGSETRNLFDISYQQRTAKAFLMKRNSNREVGLVVPTDIFGTANRDDIVKAAREAPGSGQLVIHQNGKQLTHVAQSWVVDPDPLINIGKVRVGDEVHYVGCAVYAINVRDSAFLNFVNHPAWTIKDVDYYYQSSDSIQGTWFEKRCVGSAKTTVTSCSMRLKGLFAETDYAATKLGDCGSPYGFGKKLVTHIHVGVYANYTKALAVAVPLLKAFIVQYSGDEEIDFTGDVQDLSKWDTNVQRILSVDGKPVLSVQGAPRNPGKVAVVLRTELFGKQYVYSDDPSRNLNNLAYARRSKEDVKTNAYITQWAKHGVDIYKELCAELEARGFKRVNLHERNWKPFDILKLAATGGSSRVLFEGIDVNKLAAHAGVLQPDAQRIMRAMPTLRRVVFQLETLSNSSDDSNNAHFARLLIGAINERVKSEWNKLKTPSLMRQYVFAKDEPHALAKWEKGISRSIISSTAWFLYMFARSAWVINDPDGVEVITTIDRAIAHLHNAGHDVLDGAFTIGNTPAQTNQRMIALAEKAQALGADWSPVGMDFSGWDRTIPRHVIRATFREMYGSDGDNLCAGLCGEGCYDVDGRTVRFVEKHNTLWASGLIVTLIGNSIWALAFARLAGLKHACACGDDLIGVTNKSSADLHVVAKSVNMTLKYVEGLPDAEGVTRPILFCGVSNDVGVIIDSKKMAAKILACPSWASNHGKKQALADILHTDPTIVEDKEFLQLVGEHLNEIQSLPERDVENMGLTLTLEPVEIQGKTHKRASADGRLSHSDNQEDLKEHNEARDAYNNRYREPDEDSGSEYSVSENDDDRQETINRQRGEHREKMEKLTRAVKDATSDRMYGTGRTRW